MGPERAPYSEEARVTLAHAFREAGFIQPALQNPRTQKRGGKRDKNYGKGTRVNKERTMLKEQVEDNGQPQAGEKKEETGISFTVTAVNVGKEGAKIAGTAAIAGAFGFFGWKAAESLLGLFGGSDVNDEVV